MPKAELSELLFIAMMFIIVTIISVVSIYLFIKQYNREKGRANKRNDKIENNEDEE